MAKIKQLRAGTEDLLARYLQYLKNKVKIFQWVTINPQLTTNLYNGYQYNSQACSSLTLLLIASG